MLKLTQRELVELVQNVLDTAEKSVSNSTMREKEALGRAYVGMELMKLIDRHGDPMMDAIISVDIKAATYAAAWLGTEDKNAFIYISEQDPAASCKDIVKYYFEKKNALMSVGMLDEQGSIQDGYNNIKAALERVATRSSSLANEAYDRALATEGITLFTKKMNALTGPESTITMDELNSKLAEAGLPSFDKM